MARIKINDLSKDMRVSGEELRMVRGGDIGNVPRVMSDHNSVWSGQVSISQGVGWDFDDGIVVTVDAHTDAWAAHSWRGNDITYLGPLEELSTTTVTKLNP